jgi:hypothetical protein
MKDIFRMLVLIIFSVAAFAICLFSLGRLELLQSESLTLFFPWGLSFLAFLAGAVFWWGRPKAGLRLLAVVLCLTFVFVGDVFVGVAYSCSKGDCL